MRAKRCSQLQIFCIYHELQMSASSRSYSTLFGLQFILHGGMILCRIWILTKLDHEVQKLAFFSLKLEVVSVIASIIIQRLGEPSIYGRVRLSVKAGVS
jgi:hypothetical protein